MLDRIGGALDNDVGLKRKRHFMQGEEEIRERGRAPYESLTATRG